MHVLISDCRHLKRKPIVYGRKPMMDEDRMIVPAWNNDKYHLSGAGYGLKLEAEDRDRYFRK